jgi:hypothetical protein
VKNIYVTTPEVYTVELTTATNDVGWLDLSNDNSYIGGRANNDENWDYLFRTYMKVPDLVAPVITINGNTEITLNINDSYTDEGATANDNVDGALDVTTEGTVNQNEIGTYTLTYRATDVAGNTGTATRTVNVVNLNAFVDSVIDQSNTTGTSGAGGTSQWQSFTTSKTGLLDKIEWNMSCPIIDSGEVDITMKLYKGEGTEGDLLLTSSGLKTPAYKDENGDIIGDEWVAFNISTVKNIYVTTPEVYTVELTTATNDVGWLDLSNDNSYIGGRANNDENWDYLFRTYMKVPDVVAPVITINGNAEITLNINDSYTDEEATANDNVDGALDVTTEGTVDTTTIGTYTLTYSATDVAGNTGTATRTVNVVDLSAFVDSVIDQSNTTGTSGAGGTSQWQSFTTSKTGLLDKIEWNMSCPIIDSGEVDITMKLYKGEGTEGDLLLTSSGLKTPAYKDENGDIIGDEWVAFNISTVKNIYVTTPEVYTVELTTATNDVGWLDLSNDNSYIGGRANNDENWDYLFRTYMKVPDVVAPVITINGNAEITLNINDSYTDEEATANDNVDGALTVTTEGTVDTTTIGRYTLTYSATDVAGNTGTATRTVNVVETTGPVITIIGDNPATVELGTTYSDEGASANGGETVTTSGVVDSNISISSLADTNEQLIFTIPLNPDLKTLMYFCTSHSTMMGTIVLDDSITETDKTYYVRPRPNTDAFSSPYYIFSTTPNGSALNTSSSITLYRGKTYTFIRNNNNDDHPFNIGTAYKENNTGMYIFSTGTGEAVSGSVSGVDISTLGSYIVTYSATDAAGNTGTATRTVNVVDTTAPVISVTGDNPATVELGTTYTDEEATANDNVDGVLTVSTYGTVDTSTIGTYTLTYSATDSAGNTGTATRTVNVVDTTAPVITVRGDNQATVELGATYTDAGATYDGGKNVPYSGTVDTSTIGTYTLTYSVTDSAGNTGTATRTVNVVDTTAPIITSNLVSSVINGDTDLGNVSTNGYVEWSISNSDDGNSVEIDQNGDVSLKQQANYQIKQSYIYTITATDNADNQSILKKTVYVYPENVEVVTIISIDDLTDPKIVGDTQSEQLTYTTNSVKNLLKASDNEVVVLEQNAILPGINNNEPIDTPIYLYDASTKDTFTDKELNEQKTIYLVTSINQSVTVGTIEITKTGDTSFIVLQDGTETSKEKGDIIQYKDRTILLGSLYISQNAIPIITINGDNPYIINQLGATYIDPGATSNNGETITTTGTVDTNKVGIYTITYSATDLVGNTGTATRTIEVRDTVQKPSRTKISTSSTARTRLQSMAFTKRGNIPKDQQLGQNSDNSSSAYIRRKKATTNIK